jgi:hypothetical protein
MQPAAAAGRTQLNGALESLLSDDEDGGERGRGGDDGELGAIAIVAIGAVAVSRGDGGSGKSRASVDAALAPPVAFVEAAAPPVAVAVAVAGRGGGSTSTGGGPIAAVAALGGAELLDSDALIARERARRQDARR